MRRIDEISDALNKTIELVTSTTKTTTVAIRAIYARCIEIENRLSEIEKRLDTLEKG